MQRKKVVVVTAIVGCMALAIMFGLFLLKYMLAFFVVLGMFASAGFACAIAAFFDWLSGDDIGKKNLDPIAVDETETEDYMDADIDEFIEDIKKSI